MAAPVAHDAYYEPRPSMVMRDLPHRLPDRRERLVLGRVSPYARSSGARSHAAFDAHSSPRHHLHHDDHLDGRADAMFPPDHTYHQSQYLSTLPPPVAQCLHHQSNHGVRDQFYAEARPHGHYVAPYNTTPTAQRDEVNVPSPTYHIARADDWRDYQPEVVSSHAPWAYSPPPPHAPPAQKPRSPLRLPRAAASVTVATASPRSPPTRETDVASPLLTPDLTLVGQLCAKRNCYRQACPLFGDFCEFHKPSRLCKVPECRKCAKTGGYCIAHGGGRRCQAHGCTKSAKEGGRCIAHGGGKRCQADGCDKAATAGGVCAAHA